jgi:uroporphyrinogen-III synthase
MTPPRSLLLTRPQAQSLAFAAALELELPERFRPVIAPVLCISPVPGDLDTSSAQALIFTSANGVAQYAARTPERGLPAYCVGAMTAGAARDEGMSAQSADGDVGALARMVITAQKSGAGEFIHIRGRHAAGDLVGRLRAAGVPARAVEIYDQLACPLSQEAQHLLATGGIDVLAFFSPRSTAAFTEQALFAGWNLSDSIAISLSAAASAPLAACKTGPRLIAQSPTRAGMIAALAAL